MIGVGLQGGPGGQNRDGFVFWIAAFGLALLSFVIRERWRRQRPTPQSSPTARSCTSGPGRPDFPVAPPPQPRLAYAHAPLERDPRWLICIATASTFLAVYYHIHFE